MDKEFFTISCFSNALIGDDAAVIDKNVYCKDLFCEGTHFKREWLNPYQIGQKAMLVNISDVIVMNARPKYALLGLILPKNICEAEILELSRGINDTCKKFGVSVIGGDTIAGEKLGISVSMIGELLGKATLRNGLKKGDYIAFTGELGKSLNGLKTLQNKGEICANSRFVAPNLKDKFFYKAAKYVTSAMDISDGLATDLQKLTKASKKGVKMIKKLSLAQLKSGEEYEALFSFSPKNLAKIKHIARQTRTKVTIFAIATKGSYKTHAKSHHF
ncbi:thiamine-phosphate kinase [Campylobacter majalis]|uniref:thiamine-phosphate kinase n=1 Tax=Campylobacter majalis TaxID=2790656 RepID=UPI003D693255